MSEEILTRPRGWALKGAGPPQLSRKIPWSTVEALRTDWARSMHILGFEGDEWMPVHGKAMWRMLADEGLPGVGTLAGQYGITTAKASEIIRRKIYVTPINAARCNSMQQTALVAVGEMEPA